MASILNKSGSAIRASANAIPNYSCLEKLRTVPLRSALKLDNSASFTNGKMARRDTRIWAGCVSVGLDGPMQIRLAHTDVAQVPDFTKYRRKQTKEPSARSEESDIDRRIFSYTLLFGGSVAGLMLARDTVSGLLGTMGPNAKTLAAATSEIDLSTIPEGKSVVFKWRNKPLFVRHRTAEEIERERQVIQSELRDPQDDADRVQKDQWLIVLGICTHLGCVPIANAGDYGGYYCPCHGSHYDGSGRIRKGPAPLNLEIPPYKFVSDTLVLVG